MEISGSTFSTGLAGMQAGQQRVEQAATQVAAGARSAEPAATDAVSLSDIATNLVEMVAGRNEVQASARVVETADDILGTLIDIRS